MPTLTVSEHTAVAIGASSIAFEGARASVSSAQHAALDRFSRSFAVKHRVEPLDMRIHGFRTRQYVGVMPMGGGSLEILPKFGLENEEQTKEAQSRGRRNLLRMLAAVRRLPIRDVDAQRLGQQHHDLLQIMLRLYCDRLFDQIRRGMVHRYQETDANLTCVRGRIAIAKHMRLNAQHLERLYCEFDEFSGNHRANQILKAATRRVLSQALTVETQRRARELLFVFDEVGDRNIKAEDFATLPRDRILERFADLLKFAEMILLGPYPDVRVGEREQIAVLFDMPSLFEEYIGRLVVGMAGELDVSAHLQGPKQWLAKDQESINRFQMQPDICMHRNGQVVLIADTKWKRLDESHQTLGIDQGDMYQMLGYARSYKCPRISLIYPAAAGKSDQVVKQTYQMDSATVDIVGLDLRDLDLAKEQLRGYLSVRLL